MGPQKWKNQGAILKKTEIKGARYMKNDVKDLMKKMFLPVLVLMLIIWSVIELKAACFEDYEFGQTLADTKNQLKNKNKNFISNEEKEEKVLEYSDKIFGESCSATLLFTPKSKLLAGIIVRWDTTSVGANLKNLLTKKYGKPHQPNQFMEKYIWFGIVALDYSFIKTDLVYYGGIYWDKYKQEMEEITEKEIDRF